MKRKCLSCKECLEFNFIGGNIIYYCILCNLYYELILNTGLVVISKPTGWKGNYNIP